MTLGDLLRLLCDNYVLLRIQQRLIEAKLKRLEDEVKALLEQGPSRN